LDSVKHQVVKEVLGMDDQVMGVLQVLEDTVKGQVKQVGSRLVGMLQRKMQGKVSVRAVMRFMKEILRFFLVRNF